MLLPKSSEHADQAHAPDASAPDHADHDVTPRTLGRRDFVLLSAAAGLLLGVHLPFSPRAHAAPLGTGEPILDDPKAFAPNAFVRITPDDLVTVIVKHHEMGQGTATGIATLVAEELDADWAKVRVAYAPSDPKVYNNLGWGPMQGTGGSSAIKAGYEQMRKAGAGARALLAQAAASQWKVPVKEVRVAKGVVSHGSGKRASFGQLASLAAKQPVPSDVKLKDPSQFTLIGSNHVRRVDSSAKCTGAAVYTMDLKLPGLLTAVVARAPTFSAKLRSFDAKAARAVPGVTDVVKIPEGVAVVAKGMWAALEGRKALTIQWDTSKDASLSSEGLYAKYQASTKGKGVTVTHSEQTAPSLKAAAKVIEATYHFPFLAHATMEPMNCVAWLHDGMLETWAGHQVQTLDHQLAAEAAGLPQEKVRLHTLISGGSFGRRANPWSDYVVEAVHIAKAIGGRAPVRLQRTREDDLRAGLYRPMYVHTARIGLDAQGRLVGWEHAIAGQSIQAGGPFEGMVKDGVDPTSVEGVHPTPYDIPNMSVKLHTHANPVRPLWWRSVGHTHTAYAMETLIDEAAVAAGQDPVAFRLALLKKHPRHAATLSLAATKAGWGDKLAAGRARGVAVHESFDTVVAQVAEVSLKPNGMPKVERVVVAVDCGIAVNPDVIRAQMEGGVGFGLSAALHNELTIERGFVKQSNFHDYRTLRIEDMPKVEVHIVPSTEPPTGVGEPGVPPIAPAIANALFQLTGTRTRRLPFAHGAKKTSARS
ncbi:MAG: xanthine dehydrogenase family protein molybdopterin-binding subunit [Polyangiales bacterium]